MHGGLTFINKKSQDEKIRFLFVFLIVFVSWVVQIAILGKYPVFDTVLNILYLGTIFFGITYGAKLGSFFGILASFFISTLLYDHIFYFSYPLIGLITGILRKNIFSDDSLFFLILVFILFFPFEFLNGWQYSLKNSFDFYQKYFSVAFYGSVTHLIFSLFYYFSIKYITKKINL